MKDMRLDSILGSSNFSRKISPSIFGFTLLLFFLPWVTISCGEEKIITLSGIDLAIGNKLEGNKFQDEISHNRQKENTREWQATLALLACISGILAGLLIKEERGRQIASAVSGGVGFIFLYLLRSEIDREVVTQGLGTVTADYHAGFWLAMLLFLGVCVLNVFSLGGILKKISKGININLSFKNSQKTLFCRQCGNKVGPEDAFCSECGHSIKERL